MALILAVLIVGIVAAFILSFAMGANDVANSFGTSVGSKVLTLKQAVLVAAIFETLGSILIGYQVTDTVRKGIVDIGIYDTYERAPQLAFGALATLISSCLWLFIATFRKLPVSASHAIVGATLGFTLVLSGSAGIHWSVLGFIVASWFVSPVLSGSVSAALYYVVERLILSKRDPVLAGMRYLPLIYAGTVFINVLAILWKGPQMLHLHNVPNWMAVLMAALAAVVTAALAKLLLVPPKRRYTRHGSLRRMPATNASLRGGSPNQIVLTEKARYHLEQNLSIPNVILTTASGQDIHARTDSIKQKESQFTVITNGKKFSKQTDSAVEIVDETLVKCDNDEQNSMSPETSSKNSSPTSSNDAISMALDDQKPAHNSVVINMLSETDDEKPFSSVNDEVDNINYKKRPSHTATTLLPNDDNAKPVFSVAPSVSFDPNVSPSPPPTSPSSPCLVEDLPETRILFSYVQIMTACCASFAHGGNDVSNSVGPLVTLWLIYQTGSVSANLPVPLWILLFGGAGISLGLLVLGRKVIETIGRDLTESMTPSSGFCIELGTVITVLFASKLGVPVSTTHCIVGSVISVGFLRSRESVDMKLFRTIAVSWIVTLPATIAFSAAIMYAFQLVLPNVFVYA